MLRAERWVHYDCVENIVPTVDGQVPNDITLDAVNGRQFHVGYVVPEYLRMIVISGGKGTVFGLLTSIASLSNSKPTVNCAPNRNAPMLSMPLPLPKSATSLFSRSSYLLCSNGREAIMQ